MCWWLKLVFKFPCFYKKINNAWIAWLSKSRRKSNVLNIMSVRKRIILGQIWADGLTRIHLNMLCVCARVAWLYQQCHWPPNPQQPRIRKDQIQWPPLIPVFHPKAKPMPSVTNAKLATSLTQIGFLWWVNVFHIWWNYCRCSIRAVTAVFCELEASSCHCHHVTVALATASYSSKVLEELVMPYFARLQTIQINFSRRICKNSGISAVSSHCVVIILHLILPSRNAMWSTFCKLTLRNQALAGLLRL